MTKIIELEAVFDNFEKFMDFIETNLTSEGVANNKITEILTASEEIIINVINYAYPDKKGPLEITIENKTNCNSITFTDHGNKFNPLEKPDPDITLSLDEREIGGLGILMVKKLMDEVYYEFINNKNQLIIKKH